MLLYNRPELFFLGGVSGVKFAAIRVTSFDQLKQFAISEPLYSVSYAYWYGSSESGILSGNGVVYTIHTWNNGAVVIEAYSYNQTSYDIIRFNGSTWTVTTYNAN